MGGSLAPERSKAPLEKLGERDAAEPGDRNRSSEEEVEA